MHPEPRRRSRHSRGEKYVLAGKAGQNMILSFSAGYGRRNSARRALPGESVGAERCVGPFGSFYGLLPGPAAFPGQAMGRKGGWIPLRRRPTPKVSRADIEGDERGRERGLSPFCLRMGAQRLPLPGVRWAGPLPLSGCDNRTNACSFGGLFLKKREKTSHIS